MYFENLNLQLFDTSKTNNKGPDTFNDIDYLESFKYSGPVCLSTF